MNTYPANDEQRLKGQELLYRALSENHRGLMQFEERNGMVLLFLIGWLLSSTDAQTLLSDSFVARLLLLVGVLALTLTHAIWVLAWFKRSDNLFKLCSRRTFLPESFFRSQRVDGRLAWSFSVFHLVMSAVIVSLGWTF